MSDQVTADSGPWLPDGHGLPDVARVMVSELDQPVHLRLTAPGSAYPRAGCDRALGEWWSGKPDEVTCPACLEVVHA